MPARQFLHGLTIASGAPGGRIASLSFHAIDLADLPATGTPSSSTYLRGDGTWATISAGGMAIGGAVTGGTAGSVLYLDGSGNLGQDARFFYDADGTAGPHAVPGMLYVGGGGLAIRGNGLDTGGYLAIEDETTAQLFLYGAAGVLRVTPGLGVDGPVVIQPSGDAKVLDVWSSASQTQNLQQWSDSAGVKYSRVTATGYIAFGKTSAPTAGVLSSEGTFYVNTGDNTLRACWNSGGSDFEGSIVTTNVANTFTAAQTFNASTTATANITTANITVLNMSGASVSAVIRPSTATTNAAQTVLALSSTCSASTADGFGGSVFYTARTTLASPTIQNLGRDDFVWATAANATRKGRRQFFVYDTAAREGFRLEASGSAPMIGFLGANASARLASPDLGALATTFGLASGTPTFSAANLTGTLPVANGGTGSTTGVGLIQPGMVVEFAMGTLPTGYLECDGSAVSRTTYATLFAAVGTTFGGGNGSTTFNLPDISRRVVMGRGGTAVSGPANTLGATGGAEAHTLSIGEIPSHTHTYGTTSFLGQSGSTNGTSFNQNNYTTGATGGDGAHNNVQPSIVLVKAIKT